MPYGSGKYQYELADGWAKLPQGGSFVDVCGIAIDQEDRVYVLNRGLKPIMVFDREGNLINCWGDDFFNRAHGSCIGPDHSIYCTDDKHHIVAKFSLNGKLLMTLGEKGKASDTGYIQTFDLWESLGKIVRSAPPFNRPTGVDVGPEGDIYITDGYGNAMVHKFSSDGKLLFSWGSPGGNPGQFLLPHSVRVDKKGRVWVADRENHRLQIFDAEGNFLEQWTGFIRPTDFFIDDENGIVYVCDLSMRVHILTIDGKLLAGWGNPGMKKAEALFLVPHAIAVDSHGDIYVGEASFGAMQVDKGARTIQKFVRIQ
jgi:DNA-binding beta-propeller fold protein YncE